jgi:hypothetical protein
MPRPGCPVGAFKNVAERLDIDSGETGLLVQRDQGIGFRDSSRVNGAAAAVAASTSSLVGGPGVRIREFFSELNSVQDRL